MERNGSESEEKEWSTLADAAELRWRQTSGHRWGAILAGGDGKRLLSLTRKIAGDDRPKQFCAVVGGQTLLEQTQLRVSSLVIPERTCVVVTRSHERFYGDNRPTEVGLTSRLVQPLNQGTAPAILYTLMRLRELDSGAVVAFFPSDHHFADEVRFVACIKLAFEAAECPSGPVVLLGIAPDSPEATYGWIEPGAPMAVDSGAVFRVVRFWEKPSLPLATALMERGCLWNSFIMVGRVDSFLNLIHRALPILRESFELLRPILCSPMEGPALLELYSSIRSSSFSDEVLAVCPQDLAVLAGGDLGWSDLGEAKRVLTVLGRKGIRPEWAHE